ncbi:MAG TPA: hypothetical protein VMG62_07425, partial [Solirubrobacteraceae bacterium]|nr:hypothetical protein [Solirubrobacteraceae bacterium]
AGVRVTVAGVRVCSPARLRSRGPSGCPHGSQVGRGHALLRVHAGSQAVPEQAALWVFRGPDHGGQPAFLIFGRGYTPLYQSAVSTETLETEEPPYGWRTVTSVPLIPTVMYEPDASFLSVTVTVGGSPPSRGHPTPGRIVLPASCPPGGFPFAAQASFLGGAVASASATVPCP